jgi:hypothetical protein
MIVRYDPYQIFRCSKTPVGLYARQKWLNEAETPEWRADFDESVSKLLAGQLSDGSWEHHVLTTISRLFGLHLTVRSPSEQISNALAWLLDQIDLQAGDIVVSESMDADPAALAGLPFTPGRPDMLLTGATLFLTSLFGKQDDSAVVNLYRHLCRIGVRSNGLWHDAASSHNILRALVVHPVFSKDAATEASAMRLAERQTPDGDWGPDLPFYQTLNALAHLDLPAAERQLAAAFRRLLEIQNSDGTWSRSEPEWNTFLSVHTLKNKGIL